MNALLEHARELWESNRALDAGRLLFEGIQEEARPKWAISILRMAQIEHATQYAAIQQLLEISAYPSQWGQAKELFSAIRDEVLRLEESQSISNEEKADLKRLYLAENVAKVLYNATNPIDDFDEDAGWWIAACLRDCVDHSDNKRFAQQAWETLVSLNG